MTRPFCWVFRTTAKKFVMVVDMSGSIYEPGSAGPSPIRKTISSRIYSASFRSEIELVLSRISFPK